MNGLNVCSNLLIALHRSCLSSLALFDRFTISIYNVFSKFVFCTFVKPIYDNIIECLLWHRSTTLFLFIWLSPSHSSSSSNSCRKSSNSIFNERKPSLNISIPIPPPVVEMGLVQPSSVCPKAKTLVILDNSLSGSHVSHSWNLRGLG